MSFSCYIDIIFVILCYNFFRMDLLMYRYPYPYICVRVHASRFESITSVELSKITLPPKEYHVKNETCSIIVLSFVWARTHEMRKKWPTDLAWHTLDRSFYWDPHLIFFFFDKFIKIMGREFECI